MGKKKIFCRKMLKINKNKKENVVKEKEDKISDKKKRQRCRK